MATTGGSFNRPTVNFETISPAAIVAAHTAGTLVEGRWYQVTPFSQGANITAVDLWMQATGNNSVSQEVWIDNLTGQDDAVPGQFDFTAQALIEIRDERGNVIREDIVTGATLGTFPWGNIGYNRNKWTDVFISSLNTNINFSDTIYNFGSIDMAGADNTSNISESIFNDVTIQLTGGPVITISDSTLSESSVTALSATSDTTIDIQSSEVRNTGISADDTTGTALIELDGVFVDNSGVTTNSATISLNATNVRNGAFIVDGGTVSLGSSEMSNSQINHSTGIVGTTDINNSTIDSGANITVLSGDGTYEYSGVTIHNGSVVSINNPAGDILLEEITLSNTNLTKNGTSTINLLGGDLNGGVMNWDDLGGATHTLTDSVMNGGVWNTDASHVGIIIGSDVHLIGDGTANFLDTVAGNTIDIQDMRIRRSAALNLNNSGGGVATIQLYGITLEDSYVMTTLGNIENCQFIDIRGYGNDDLTVQDTPNCSFLRHSLAGEVSYISISNPGSYSRVNVDYGCEFTYQSITGGGNQLLNIDLSTNSELTITGDMGASEQISLSTGAILNMTGGAATTIENYTSHTGFEFTANDNLLNVYAFGGQTHIQAAPNSGTGADYFNNTLV